MKLGSQRNMLLLVFFITALLLFLYAWYYFPFVADDSFISFRYSDRLLQGKGLTWTEGKPVEGYSNLLWVLIIALLRAITHAEPWIIAWVVDYLLSVATLWILLKIIGRVTSNNYIAVIAAAGLFAGSATVAIWVNGGLEEPLVMFLLIAAIDCLSLRNSLKKIWVAGIYLGLLCLTRPDGILFTWSVTLGLICSKIDNKQWRQLIRPLIFLNIFSLVFYSGQLLFRLSYYGEWVPNTALVKVSFNWLRASQGFDYVKGMLKVYVPFLLLAFFFLWKSSPRCNEYFIFSFLIVFISCLYLVIVGGDIFPGYRHSLPLVPLLCGLGGVGIMLLAERVYLKPLFQYIIIFVVLAGEFYFQFQDIANKRAVYERWEWQARGIGETLEKGFKSYQPSIGLAAAGTVPYFTEFSTLDMLGLNDYYLPRHPPENFGHGSLGHELGDASYFIQQMPDMFLLNGFGDSLPTLFKQEARMYFSKKFQYNYIEVKLLCSLDYELWMPDWRHDFGRVLKTRRPCFLYINKYSPRLGIQRIGRDRLIVPCWLLVSQSNPEMKSTLKLDSSSQLYLPVRPKEAYFISSDYLKDFLEGEILDSCRFTAVTKNNSELVIASENGALIIANHGRNTVELHQILILSSARLQ